MTTQADDTGKKVFIGGLDYDLREEDLRSYFGDYGEITDARVVMNEERDRSRGFGFVAFSETSMAEKVIESAPHKIGNRTVEIKMAVPKEKVGFRGADLDKFDDGTETCKLFIGGVKAETTAEDLMRAFSDEKPQSAEVIKDRETGKPRGFAFVLFSSADTVDRLAGQKRRNIIGRDVELKKGLSSGSMRDAAKSIGGGPIRSRGGRLSGRLGGGGGGGFNRNNDGREDYNMAPPNNNMTPNNNMNNSNVMNNMMAGMMSGMMGMANNPMMAAMANMMNVMSTNQQQPQGGSGQNYNPQSSLGYGGNQQSGYGNQASSSSYDYTSQNGSYGNQSSASVYDWNPPYTSQSGQRYGSSDDTAASLRSKLATPYQR